MKIEGSNQCIVAKETNESYYHIDPWNSHKPPAQQKDTEQQKKEKKKKRKYNNPNLQIIS